MFPFSDSLAGIARDLSPWLLAASILLFCLWGLAFLASYRFLGRQLDVDAAFEWLQRWPELRSLERWTIFKCYTQMSEWQQGQFRDLFVQLDCKTFIEFRGFERQWLLVRGDRWLRKQILMAWLEVPNLNWFRSWVLLVPMDHPEGVATFPQVQAYAVRRTLFVLAIMATMAFLICLYLQNGTGAP